MQKANAVLKFFRTNLLTILTVFGVGLGVGLGFILRGAQDDWSKREVMYIRFVGDLFLRMLKALILPLIISSLVSAIGSLDLSLSGKIGFRAIGYYMFTTAVAVILGICLVVSIQPGKNGTKGDVDDSGGKNVTTADTLMDLLRNMFPPNLVQATVQQTQTVLIYNASLPNKEDWNFETRFQDGTNIMGLVVFAVVLGITLARLKEKGKPVLDFFTSLSEASMMITNWVVWISPIGVCFLIAGQLIEVKDINKIFQNLGLYFATVMIGLLIHGFILLPLLYSVLTRSLPFRFILNMTEALTTAFGTASSSATLPVTIACLENKNKVDTRVSRFVLPIGATINMDGTALYEAVAAIYIAQLVDLPISFGNIIAISITATAASIGAAGIPQAGLVTMVMVLNTIGLPAEYVTYILPVDWLLDRFRTAINVLGDSFGAGIVDKLSKTELEKSPMDESTYQSSEARHPEFLDRESF